MERKIGEIFEYKGKIYKVAEFDDCRNCAFRYINCSSLRSITGNCMDFLRNDGVNVKFKEIKDMESKDNKLTINIPDGMEIDVENSDLETGVIKFKNKELTYKGIQDSVGYPTYTFVTTHNRLKINAIDMLMNIAKYYNGNWKPDGSNIDERKFYILYDNRDESYTTEFNTSYSTNIVYFKNKEDAQAVIDNPNFRVILDVIYKN